MEYTNEDLEQSIEETRQDIEDKRASMSEKLELLEERVRDTLEETRSTVEDIVENVKETVDETVGAVKETVEGARSTVDSLVENVKGTMDETASMVKKSFDLNYQVEQRPWVMLGGSVLVGYLLGSWMSQGVSYQQGYSEREYSSSSDDETVLHTAPVRDGASFDDLEESVDTQENRDASNKYRAPVKSASHAQPRPWSNFLGPFQEEWDSLKGVALGTLMGTLRTMVRQHMPTVAPKLEQAINSASAKLGAEPIDFPSAQDQFPDTHGHTQSRESSTPEGQGSQASSLYGRSTGIQGSEPLAAKGSSRNPYS